MSNIKQATADSRQPNRVRSRTPSHWLPGVGSWMLVFFSITLHAQLPPAIPPGGAMQLQIRQPPVDVSPPENITITTEFDPPAINAGGKAYYRVALEAVPDSIKWPAEITAPAGLQLDRRVRGELTRIENNKFRPLTAYVYEVTATRPGTFSLSNLTVEVAGRILRLPAATLNVLPAGQSAPVPARRLFVEVAETNLYVGQPFRLRVVFPAGPQNEVEALREIQLNGTGLITDRLTQRQMVEATTISGEKKTAFVYETVATPMSAGTLEISAQAFTAGREFAGPISITGQVTLPGGPAKYALLMSDGLRLNVHPLPAGKELPGFTGAVGKFIAGVPQLATNRLRVGEPVHLSFTFQSAGDLARFVPPVAPRSREWQIIPDPAPGGGFTLIPLTDEATNTPAIPFCTFDPVAKRFTDQTIPALPVTVIGEGLPTKFLPGDREENNVTPPTLSQLRKSPGKSASSLQPLQMQGWFITLQLLPVAGFIALWRWDARRRFLETHPEIVRRRQARLALRREKASLHKAAMAGDRESFARHAATALRIAVAPHFPAEARALVGADVLSQLKPQEQAGSEGSTVRNIFAAADAQFAATPPAPDNLPVLQSEVEAVLKKLEERL